MNRSRHFPFIWRIAQIFPVIVLATFIVFSLLHLAPGDPAMLLAGENPTPERLEQVRALYGLDRPFFIQYLSWLGHAVQGDLSKSILTSEPVLDSILRSFPHTLLIVVLAMILSIVIGVPLGITAATRAGSPADAIVTSVSSLGIAVPNFWLAMMLITLFSLGLNWLPATGAASFSESPFAALHHAVLPAIAIAATGTAEIARQVRSAMAEVLSSQYVRTLRAKGLSSTEIIYKHGLKNIGVTLLTVIGLVVNRLLGATVVVEAVFAIPGIGSLVVQAALGKDFPVIQGVVLAMVVVVLITNIIIDSLYGIIDPRIDR